MNDAFPVVVAVHFINFHGEGVLGANWNAFAQTFKKSLQVGTESPDKLKLSENEYFFETPFKALDVWFKALQNAKSSRSWPKSAGAAPVQAIFRSPSESIDYPQGDPPTPIWCFVCAEQPYATAQIASYLYGAEEAKREKIIVEAETAHGLHPISVKNQYKIEKFSSFPETALPAKHDEVIECFYCGCFTHAPAACPSKRMSSEVQGLSYVGYIPIVQLYREYERVLRSQNALEQELINGVDAGTLRRRPDLNVFCAFFDVNRIYQLRYLSQLAFSGRSRWPGLTPCKINAPASGNPLFLGLDCLRVGKLCEAENILEGVVKRTGGGSFFAVVGLAFTALEQGNSEKFFRNLESAKTRADGKVESLYALFLLSRYNELYGDFRLADRLTDELTDLCQYCLETKYRRIQMDALKGGDQTLPVRILDLVSRERLYFPIALLDPKLYKVADSHELALAACYEWLSVCAIERLGQTRSQCKDLINWMGEEDAILKPVMKGLVNLEDLAKTNSYFGNNDLLTSAVKLDVSIKGLVNAKRGTLRKKLKKVSARLEGNNDYWSAYPCKGRFSQYPEDLSAAAKLLDKAKQIEKKKEIKLYCDAIELLSQVERQCQSMETIRKKMDFVKSLYELGKNFAAKLMAAEIFCLILWLAGVLAASIFERSTTGELSAIISASSAKSFSLIFLSVFIAPIFSLAIALKKGLSTEEKHSQTQ